MSDDQHLDLGGKTTPPKIVKDVPMPPPEAIINRRGGPHKYPFHQMAVGDSFQIPKSSTYLQVMACIRVYRHKYDPDFKAVIAEKDGHLWLWCEAVGKKSGK